MPFLARPFLPFDIKETSGNPYRKKEGCLWTLLKVLIVETDFCDTYC
jgi:hypothetical protein